MSEKKLTKAEAILFSKLAQAAQNKNGIRFVPKPVK